MARFSGMTPAWRAGFVGVLAIILLGVFTSCYFVVGALAAPGLRAPVITSSRANPTPSSSAAFGFTDSPSTDTSPERPHCFRVYAIGWARRTGPITRSCWPAGTVTQNFAVGGNLTTPLYPGTSQRLNLTFTNPGSWPITIPGGGISAGDITVTSHAPGCASSNFAVIQGLTSAVTISAHQLTAVSLSALRVPQGDWPVIEMIETNTNQDACQGAKLTLTYSRIEAGR
jgi:hypothetical protein